MTPLGKGNGIPVKGGGWGLQKGVGGWGGGQVKFYPYKKGIWKKF